jgi:hypothetical protein
MLFKPGSRTLYGLIEISIGEFVVPLWANRFLGIKVFWNMGQYTAVCRYVSNYTVSSQNTIILVVTAVRARNLGYTSLLKKVSLLRHVTILFTF